MRSRWPDIRNRDDETPPSVGPIAAPVGGVVLFVVTSPAIKKDGLLLAIGELP